MKKLIVSILIVLMLASCTKSNQNSDIKADLNSITAKIENSIELQQSMFVGTVKSVATEKALITKYNIDITEYTVYTVEVTESIDGITPLGEISVYCVGTSKEFSSRNSLDKNESYVLIADPWVYGDRIIYLLSAYEQSYPKIDTAGMVTLEQNGVLYDCGNRQEFLKLYYDAKQRKSETNTAFYFVSSIANRYVEIFTAVNYKNSDTTIYENEMYEWTPDAEFIKLTADTSAKVLGKFTDITLDTSAELSSIKQIFEEYSK